MKLSTLVQKVQRNVDDCGWWVTAKKSLTFLLGPVYKHQVYRIYKINLEMALPRCDFGLDDFTYKVLRANEDQVVKQIEKKAEFLRGQLKEKIADGSICLVALHKGKLAGFNLINFGEVFIPLIELTHVFRTDEAWSEHIAVDKDFRRMGLASQLRYRVFEELRSRGIRKLYGGTLSINVPNLKLTRKVGFSEFVDIDYIKILNFKTWRYKRIRQ